MARIIPGRLGFGMRSALLAASLLLPVFPARAASPEAPPGLPRFEDFPAGPASAGRNRLVLKGGDVHWRTRLRWTVGQKPDFAGHYVLASWGCGTECVMGAAVDVRTGTVVWLPASLCCWYSDEQAAPEDVEPLRFRLDSRLLVLTGRRDERDGDAGTHYYSIEGNRFVHLRDVPLPGRP